MLAEISGMAAVTLQPAAGAHGELTGILMIRAYHQARGDHDRREVIVPDSSHGTNPATASMAGFTTVTVPSDARRRRRPRRAAGRARAADGGGDAHQPLDARASSSERIVELLDAVHAAGALAYMDGANMNAVLGKFRPGAAGFDVMHFNLHKTFSTPHGGGGPGAGPVAVGERLLPFLPSPLVVREADGTFRLERPASARPRSAGCAPTRAAPASSCAPTPTSARTAAAAWSRSARTPCWPPTTCKRSSAEAYELPFDRPCKHEFVATARLLKEATGVRTLDIAKRLIDNGFHPPTIYFPLIVEECLLIEPTETEIARDARRLRRRPCWPSRARRARTRSWSRALPTARPCGASTRPPPHASRTCAGAP